MKKLSFIIDSLYFGGAEVSAVTMCNEAIERGYNVDLIVLRNVGKLKKKLSKKVNLIIFRKKKVSRSLLSLIFYFWNIKPDIIFSYLDHVNIIVSISKSIACQDSKLITTVHNPFEYGDYLYYSRFKKYMYYYLIKYILPLSAIIAPVSEGISESLKKIIDRRHHNKITKIYNPIIFKKKEDFKLISKNKETYTFIFVGRLHIDKGVDGILNAIKKLNEKISNFELLIYGNGPERENLIKLVRKLEIEEIVKFCGYQNDTDLIYQNADCLLLNSKYESFGRVLLEALSFGCTVISADCPVGPREILKTSKFGELYPPGDLETLTTLMLKSIKNKKNKSNYKSDELNNYLNQFSPNIIFEKYLNDN